MAEKQKFETDEQYIAVTQSQISQRRERYYGECGDATSSAFRVCR
jgi:hypothetical protein